MSTTLNVPFTVSDLCASTHIFTEEDGIDAIYSAMRQGRRALEHLVNYGDEASVFPIYITRFDGLSVDEFKRVMQSAIQELEMDGSDFEFFGVGFDDMTNEYIVELTWYDYDE